MKQFVRWGAVVAALALVVSGCGSKSGSSGSGGGDGAITIGMLSPANAQFFNTPDEIAAVKAALATINAQGGVKGHQLRLEWCNEANDPNKGTACARQLATDNSVVATVASITTSAADTVTSLLSHAGMANVAYKALTTSEFQATNNFPFDGGAAWETVGAVQGAVQQDGIKKVVLVRNDNPQTVPAEDLLKQAVPKLGIAQAGTVLLPPTAIPDYSSYAQKIISSGADLAVIPLSKTQAIGVINAVRQLGSQMKFAINAGAFSDADLAQLGPNANGLLVFSPGPWISDAAVYPGINDFIASMNAERARGDNDADVTQARPFTLMDWVFVQDLVQVMNQIIDSGQQVTRQNVLNTLSKATNLTTANALKDPWSPANRQTAVPGYPNVSTTTGYLLTVQNGHQKLTSPEPVDVLNALK